MNKMELNEIKKTLYKENPKAHLFTKEGGVYCYTALIGKLIDGIVIRFDVPLTEMGETEFKDEMEAKHLIRWIASDEAPHCTSCKHWTKKRHFIISSHLSDLCILANNEKSFPKTTNSFSCDQYVKK